MKDNTVENKPNQRNYRIEEWEFNLKVLFVDRQKGKSKAKVWGDIDTIEEGLKGVIEKRVVKDNTNFDFIITTTKERDYSIEECKETFSRVKDEVNGQNDINGNQIGNRRNDFRTIDNFIDDMDVYVV